MIIIYKPLAAGLLPSDAVFEKWLLIIMGFVGFAKGVDSLIKAMNAIEERIAEQTTEVDRIVEYLREIGEDVGRTLEGRSSVNLLNVESYLGVIERGVSSCEDSLARLSDRYAPPRHHGPPEGLE